MFYFDCTNTPKTLQFVNPNKIERFAYLQAPKFKWAFNSGLRPDGLSGMKLLNVLS